MSDTPKRSQRGRLLCAAGSFTTMLVVACGVFIGLPSRWMPVDAAAVVLSLACAVSGVLLVLNSRFAERVARIVAFVVLAVGLTLVVVLAATASYLSGIYGPVGKGGAMVLVFIAVLAVPYAIAIPGAQLLYLGARPPSDS